MASGHQLGCLPANKREKSHSQAQGEPMSSRMTRSSEPHPPPRPHERIFILAFFAIEILIATVFDNVFKLESRDFGDFNNIFYLFNNGFKLEVAYDFDYDVSSHTIHTIAVASSFNFGPTGVEVTECNNLECDLCAALTSTTAITITTEYENKMKYEGEPHGSDIQVQIYDSTTPVIAANDRMEPDDVELREFDIIKYISNGNMDKIALKYDISCGMFIFIFIFFYFFLV